MFCTALPFCVLLIHWESSDWTCHETRDPSWIHTCFCCISASESKFVCKQKESTNETIEHQHNCTKWIAVNEMRCVSFFYRTTSENQCITDSNATIFFPPNLQLCLCSSVFCRPKFSGRKNEFLRIESQCDVNAKRFHRRERRVWSQWGECEWNTIEMKHSLPLFPLLTFRVEKENWCVQFQLWWILQSFCHSNMKIRPAVWM